MPLTNKQMENKIVDFYMILFAIIITTLIIFFAMDFFYKQMLVDKIYADNPNPSEKEDTAYYETCRGDGYNNDKIIRCKGWLWNKECYLEDCK